MSKVFLMKFKRDNFHINPRPNAQTVLGQIDRWFEDHNESHPIAGPMCAPPGSSSELKTNSRMLGQIGATPYPNAQNRHM